MVFYLSANDPIKISTHFEVNPDASSSLCVTIPLSNLTFGSTNMFNCSNITRGRYVEISNGPKSYDLTSDGKYLDICEIFVYGISNKTTSNFYSIVHFKYFLFNNLIDIFFIFLSSLAFVVIIDADTKQFIHSKSFSTQSSTAAPEYQALKANDVFTFNNLQYSRNVSCSKTNNIGENWWGVDLQSVLKFSSVTLFTSIYGFYLLFILKFIPFFL